MVAALESCHFKGSRKINFLKSVSDGSLKSLKCEKCRFLLRSPKQSICGHRFCQDCLDLLRNDPSGIARCPVDGEELGDNTIFTDKCCERDINNLKCHCYNYDKDYDRGCRWTGELLHLEKHEESECEYSLKECPNPGCKEEIERRHADNHAKNTCNFRLITCEHCGGKVIHGNEKLHLEKCPKIEVQCTSGCGAMVARGELEEHVTKQCINAPVACTFQHCGCSYKGSRGDLEEHLSTATKEHIQLLGDQEKKSSENLQKMEEQVKKLESEKERLETQMKESREALAYAKQDLQTQQTKIAIVEKSITKQKEEMGKLVEILDSIHAEKGSDNALESQLGEIISLLESQGKRITDIEGELIKDANGLGTSYLATSSDRRLDRNEHICALSEAKINQHDIRLQMLEATSYDGTYIWKIDEWAKRVREAKIGKATSIYSPPFYVGRYGYKVCGRLYPCGDGIGKDTHVSMFFVVMKGEFDALLSWPFTQKVTFRLIDPNHVQDVTDSFRPDPRSSSFQRPKSAMNIASGTPQFVSQKDLNNRGFIVEDTLYIKISVDKTGLREL